MSDVLLFVAIAVSLLIGFVVGWLRGLAFGIKGTLSYHNHTSHSITYLYEIAEETLFVYNVKGEFVMSGKDMVSVMNQLDDKAIDDGFVQIIFAPISNAFPLEVEHDKET